ncbi:hypothetical protein BWI96_20855 [Siphonobacter sp. SORGH_AS_0500]|uniref:hypothetical protein n=1 Tax=Siphonobacter sp. SORGH_AS_0500 TaxID=1864824 RepID=UPI000CA72AD0|nr:hypothetical protein [Siphonobacter sp. SORGH_AS_0500]PKK34679.1 hypothetical protein BWI96_20855 [Siphonobacter sp. SORGH_AS_0500]
MDKLITVLLIFVVGITTSIGQTFYYDDLKAFRRGTTRMIFYLKDFKKDTITNGKVFSDLIYLGGVESIGIGETIVEKEFKLEVKNYNYISDFFQYILRKILRLVILK